MPITPKGVIVHSMSEYLKLDDGPMYAHDFLKSIGLSVHGFVKPDGTYEKMVSSPGKAFHAGKSEWNGLSGLNSHYLGFELSNILKRNSIYNIVCFIDDSPFLEGNSINSIPIFYTFKFIFT